jgi:hypothetical protein
LSKVLKNDNSADVPELVLALASTVQGCRKELTAYNLSAILSSLSKLSSDGDKVRELVSALASKVKGCREDFLGRKCVLLYLV